MAPISGNQVPPETAGQHAFECSASGKRTIPVLEVHGTSDTTVFPVNSEDVIEQFTETNRLAADGGDIERTQTDNGQVEGGFAYTIEEYEGDGMLLMERYVVNGLGHLWAGGTGTFPLSDPKAPDATQFIWDFVSQYTLP
jgi:poly(3-hydroxybutyrate) depolymerase